MTPLSPARRDAEAFALAVENRAGVVDGPRGDVADRFADLLTCVDVLRTQEPPAPRADFVANLRMQLMDAADTLLLPADAPLAPVISLVDRPSRRQRRLSVAAAAFVVIGGTAGVAAASEHSLPGDPLYPIKRGIESAQVSLNSSDSGRGQDLLRQASTRLDEVDSLIAADSPANRIKTTLDAFQHSASDGADLLIVSFERDGDTQDITRLRTMLGSQMAKLDQLSAQAPESAKPSFTSARTLISDLDQQASMLCSGCGPASARYVSLSSAATLESLLNPGRAAQAAAQAAKNSKLAEKAAKIAKNTKPGAPKIGTGTPVPTPGTVTGSTSDVALPSTSDPLGDAVKGLTGGITELLSGGSEPLAPLAPLTDTLNTTIDTISKGLLQ